MKMTAKNPYIQLQKYEDLEGGDIFIFENDHDTLYFITEDGHVDLSNGEFFKDVEFMGCNVIKVDAELLWDNPFRRVQKGW